MIQPVGSIIRYFEGVGRWRSWETNI